MSCIFFVSGIPLISRETTEISEPEGQFTLKFVFFCACVRAFMRVCVRTFVLSLILTYFTAKCFVCYT